jgi:mRNA interferase MazF
MNYIPDKGHIVWLTFDPQAGHEQTGRRPALVLSPKEYNIKTCLAIMCPITTAIKEYPFEVLLPDKLPVKGVILSDQIKNLDWKVREAEFCCKISNTIVGDVLAKIKALLF